MMLLWSSCSTCYSCRMAKKGFRELHATRWQVVQMNGKTVQHEGNELHFRLDTQTHQMTGYGICNAFSGTFSTDGTSSLSFEKVAATLRQCKGQAIEAEFLEILERTTRYDMDGEMMLLMSGNELIAVLQATE